MFEGIINEMGHMKDVAARYQGYTAYYYKDVQFRDPVGGEKKLARKAKAGTLAFLLGGAVVSILLMILILTSEDNAGSNTGIVIPVILLVGFLFVAIMVAKTKSTVMFGIVAYKKGNMNRKKFCVSVASTETNVICGDVPITMSQFKRIQEGTRVMLVKTFMGACKAVEY